MILGYINLINLKKKFLILKILLSRLLFFHYSALISIILIVSELRYKFYNTEEIVKRRNKLF